jgi:hypothetical protein
MIQLHLAGRQEARLEEMAVLKEAQQEARLEARLEEMAALKEAQQVARLEEMAALEGG